MQFVYENQGTNTFLVYEIGPNDELDTMSLGMLTNNAIPGFAPAAFTQMDTTRYIKYNVSAKVSVSQLFSGPVNKKRLIGVFTGIVNAMISAEDYMLDTGSLLLDHDYIFADVSTGETELVCLPIMNQQRQNPELGMFFKNIIFNTQFDKTENCDHVAQILNHLNSTPVLMLADFKELLEDISKDSVSAPQPVAQPAPKPVAQPAPQPVAQPAPQPVAQPAPQPVAPAQPVPQTASRAAQVGATAAVKTPPMPVFNKNEHPKPAAAPIPPVGIPNAPKAPQSAPQAESKEKPMSFFYLMQHYNKENAAIYKAQQDAKKGAPPAPKAAPARPQPAPKQTPGGFAIPGQQAPAPGGFAIPGQQAPAPKPVQPAMQPKPKAVVPPQPAAPVYQQPAAPAYQQPAAPAYQQPAAPATSISFGETTVLGGSIGETTVLGGPVEAVKNEPHLIRTKNNEKIPLNKPVFRIGKERSYVDYFIGDNTAISRSHANIVNHNGEFFVVDTNSTNHTYVNGGMIQSNVETKLSHGTKIRLANEDFEFKMY